MLHLLGPRPPQWARLSLGGESVGRLYAVIRPFGFLILLVLVMSPILGGILRPIQNAVIRLIFRGIA